MISPAVSYDGDDALERLLKRSGSPYDLTGLRGLVAGVEAAPRGEAPEAWMGLVAAQPSEALRAQLRAFRQVVASASPGPLSPPLAERLAALQKELSRRDLGGFIVPRADEHQGEYVAPRAERLYWLTGFNGSAGFAIVLAEQAAIFVDGRYTLQVREQVDGSRFEPRHLHEQPPEDWIAANLPAGSKLGYDPWLHTPDGLARLRAAAAKAGGSLVPVADNPLDAVWPDRPPAPLAPVAAHDLRYAGSDSESKRQALAAALAADKLDAAVLTAPDSIAWLLNIRGGDLPRTPVALGLALLHKDGAVELFMDRRKLLPGLDVHLGNAVAVAPPEAFGLALDRLGAAGARVRVDPSTAAGWIFDRLKAAGAWAEQGADPCALPKARKNAVEIDGARAAHRRDGAALTRFLAWLGPAARAGGLGEIAAIERLAEFRRQGDLFRDFSFDSISGAGPNGAIVHYRATPASERRLQAGELYLIDSGAQYLDGTTDVTRTVAIGAPTAEMRDRFTRVLKGHIALGRARFPRGTTGSQLDALARTALWQVGLDYDHGTGHGVGSYLSVHEGPQRISKLPSRIALEPGMIVSNEPGYYKTGAYGIRIENLIVVTEAPASGDERAMLEFETLTLAPIDRALVETSLLAAEEIAWLDAYHARVRSELSPLVDAETAAWLVEATRPLGG
jgi:Xaa-Pro aminopeptidase